MSDLSSPAGSPQRVKCPACSELIIEGARLCKFCKEILDPALRQERARASAGPVRQTAEQAAFERRAARSLGLALAGTILLSWTLGLVLGPLLLLRARRLAKDADRQGIPRPGAIAGVFVLGLVSLFLALTVGSAVAIPFYIQATSPAYVYLDNGLPGPVELQVDGRKEGAAAAGEHSKLSIQRGKHRLLVRAADGASLYDGRQDLEGGGKYLLNPSGQNRYEVVSNEYSVGATFRVGSAPTPEPLPGDPFMNVSKYDFILEPLPSTILMPAGVYSTRRQAVRRAPGSSPPASASEPAPQPAAVPGSAPSPQEVPVAVPKSPARASVKVERRVRLELEADSWRDGGAFPIEKELKEKLAQGGVGVLGQEEKRADGRLKVSYSENKGKEYKPVGGDTKIGDGTDIDLEVEVLDAEGSIVAKFEARGGTPEFLQGSNFFEAALDALRRHPVYQHLEYFVAASLGMESALPKLLPALTWDEARDPALKLLRGYSPRTSEETALLALGREDYDSCVRLGAAALDPLLEVFERGSFAPGMMNEKALAAIVAIGGPRAQKAVLSQLASRKDQAQFGSDELLELIRATVKLGDASAVPILQEIAKAENEECAAEAKKALRALRHGETPGKAGPAPAVSEASGDAQADRSNERGLDRLRNGKWSAATASFTQAIELVPKHGPYYWNRARSQWNAKSWSAAIADLEKAAELLPAREDEARLRIYIARARLGDLGSAARDLKSYAVDRRDRRLAALAELLTGGKAPEKLVSQASSEGGDERLSQANFYAGMGLVLRGDLESARVYLKKASSGSGWEAESARLELERLEK